MPFTSEAEAITYIFRSLGQTDWRERGLDEDTRDTTHTVRLLTRFNLINSKCDYTVVTGSKGKGSVTMITARILRELGHTVGTITSPQLVNYRERIRINGQAIPQADLLRILTMLQPEIDAIQGGLSGNQYISPQGIFLAIALQWFNEQGVRAAVLEVGRGGRYDDIALVPNRVALFTPIILEHTRYLGPTLERIAWHKAGIIKQHGEVYSVPQPKEVLDVIAREADTKDAEFFWFSTLDMGVYLGNTADGIRMRLTRYGEFDVSLMGRYEVENVTLSVQAAGNIHGWLGVSDHQTEGYVEKVTTALADVHWPGRMQRLQDNPAVYIDGAINVRSARLLLDSVRERLTEPVVVIAAVPRDRDYDAVYEELGTVSDTLVLTESTRNVTIFFPERETAIASAQPHFQDITHTTRIADAVEIAKQKAGPDGTILMAVAQPAIGDAMEHWGFSFEQL